MSRSTAQPRGECQAKPPHRAVWAVWAGGSTAPSGGEGPARGHATGDRESRCDLDSHTRPHARPHTRAPARLPPQCRAWLGLGRLGPGQGLGPRPHRRHGPATRCSVQRARPPRKHRPSPRRQARREGSLRPRRVGCRARRSVQPAAVEQREARRRQTWRKAALRPRPADGGRPRVNVTSRRRCRFRAHNLRRRRRPAVRGSALRVPAPSALVNGLVHRRSSASPARLRPGPRHPALPRSFAGTSVNYSTSESEL